MIWLATPLRLKIHGFAKIKSEHDSFGKQLPSNHWRRKPKTSVVSYSSRQYAVDVVYLKQNAPINSVALGIVSAPTSNLSKGYTCISSCLTLLTQEKGFFPMGCHGWDKANYNAPRVNVISRTFFTKPKHLTLVGYVYYVKCKDFYVVDAEWRWNWIPDCGLCRYASQICQRKQFIFAMGKWFFMELFMNNYFSSFRPSAWCASRALPVWAGSSVIGQVHALALHTTPASDCSGLLTAHYCSQITSLQLESGVSLRAICLS